MDFLIDFVPALAFLLTFKVWGIFVATQIAMGAAVLQLIASRWRYGKIKAMHLFTFVIIIVFGGLTLFFRDEMFVKWKPTILNWSFALVFLFAPLLFKRNLLRTMLGDKIKLPDFAWGRLNWMWIAYFAAIGAVNLYVAYNFPTDTWVNFRFYGLYSALIGFMVLQGLYLYKHMEELPEQANPDPVVAKAAEAKSP